MARLGSPTTFSLGGEGFGDGKPWVVNLLPQPDATNIPLLRPVRLSVRDVETFVDPSSILVAGAYAHVFSHATDYFDNLPRTTRGSLDIGSGLLPEPTIAIVSDGLQITKAVTGLERSIYFTSIDGGSGYSSVVASFLVRQDVFSPLTSVDGPLNTAIFPPGMPAPFDHGPAVRLSGTVVALEHGPRNRAVYLFFEQNGGVNQLRLADSLNADPTVDMLVDFDWSTMHRLTILWNEAQDKVQIFDEDSLLFTVPIDSLATFDSNYIRRGGLADITAIYGQEGSVGSRSTWGNICVTTDVVFPVLGTVLPGDCITQCVGDALVHMLGNKDPRDLDLSPWFDTTTELYPNNDPNGTKFVASFGFRQTKATTNTTLATYREEPSLGSLDTGGFLFQASVNIDLSQQDDSSTGAGFVFFDGENVYQFTFFSDVSGNSIGLLKVGGNPSTASDHYITPFDWTVNSGIRIILDPRQALISIYSTDDLTTVLGSIPLNRADFPSASDFGWSNQTPFLAFGHTVQSQALGSFDVKNLSYASVYQGWDSTVLPTDYSVPFTETTSGSATSSLSGGSFILSASANNLRNYRVEADFDDLRGVVVESGLSISSWSAGERTGVNVVLDDTLRSFMLAFVDDEQGRFIAVPQRLGAGTWTELVALDGPNSLWCSLIDWTQFHTYRLELRRRDGFYVYVDLEATPRIAIPESNYALLPDSFLALGEAGIGFGQFTSEGSTSSWSYVRGMFGNGYEISFKKNESDAVLREELFQTQSIVVVSIKDF